MIILSFFDEKVNILKIIFETLLRSHERYDIMDASKYQYFMIGDFSYADSNERIFVFHDLNRARRRRWRRELLGAPDRQGHA